MTKNRKFREPESEKRTVLEIMHKDLSVDITVLEEQLKVVAKLQQALPVLLQQHSNKIKETLTGYLAMTQKLLGGMHKSLCVREAQIQKAVNLWKKGQLEEEEREWQKRHSETPPQQPQNKP